MPEPGARLVWITPNEALAASEGWVMSDLAERFFHAAHEPVKRQRCVTTGHGGSRDVLTDRCFVGWNYDREGEPCRFVEEWCIPATEEEA
jgi:hypothetical protein